MITKFFVFLLFLVGCGSYEQTVLEKKVETPFYIDIDKVDSDVLPYVMEFAGYCEKFELVQNCKKNFNKIKKIKVVSSFEERLVVGKCYLYKTGERRVEINGTLMHLDSFSMQAVVIHEIAHCVLGAETDIFPHYDEAPDIMNTYLLPEKILFLSWPSLIESLFERASPELSLTAYQSNDIVTSTLINKVGGFGCETRKN